MYQIDYTKIEYKPIGTDENIEHLLGTAFQAVQKMEPSTRADIMDSDGELYSITRVNARVTEYKSDIAECTVTESGTTYRLYYDDGKMVKFDDLAHATYAAEAYVLYCKKI